MPTRRPTLVLDHDPTLFLSECRNLENYLPGHADDATTRKVRLTMKNVATKAQKIRADTTVIEAKEHLDEAGHAIQKCYESGAVAREPPEVKRKFDHLAEQIQDLQSHLQDAPEWTRDGKSSEEARQHARKREQEIGLA